jgi:hypothetical protein
MSDTPETDAFIVQITTNEGPTGVKWRSHAERLERERDEAIFFKNTSAADFLKQIRQITLCKDVAREKLLMAEKERDETRKQFVDFLNKTEDYKRERDEAKQIISSALTALPVGYIPARMAESIPNRIADLCNEIAKLERRRDEAREQIKELIYIAERAIDLAEIDFENDKFGVVSELRDDLAKIKKSK